MFDHVVMLPLHVAAGETSKLDPARYRRDPETTGALVKVGVAVDAGVMLLVWDAVAVEVTVLADVDVETAVREGVAEDVKVMEGVVEPDSVGSL